MQVMARSSETPAFWSVDCSFRKKFRVMKVSLERCFGVSLPLPLFPVDPSERMLRLKEFCSAPMERKPHAWDVYLQKLGKRSRFSIWMSLFLFRKILPSSSPDLESFMDKVSVPSPDPDPVFMDYVRQEVPRMFRRGWDRGYFRQTELAVVSTSACAEKSRMKGGCRMYWLEQYHDEARSAFIDYLRGGSEVFSYENLKSPVPARLAAVPTAGKVRLLSVPSGDAQLLLPFHKTFYNHISRFSWLLRGDAKANRFKDFLRKDGEVFVSGDYESATDCLNQNVQKEILRLILQNCDSVPNELRLRAMDSLSTELSLERPDGTRRIERVRTGQMMGFPISFPLLCVVNYLAFRFATMDKSIPVRINGDDIVFRAKPSVAQRWMDSVGKAGLRLSRGKTLVDCSVFTLNSCLFSSSRYKVISLPFIRAKALFGVDEGYTSIVGRYQSFAPGFGALRSFRLRSMFLRQNIGFITKSRRSLNRGLGISVPEALLKTSRLWRREVDYLSLPREKKPPPSKSMWEMQPEGYHIEHYEEKKILGKQERRELVDAVVKSAWRIPSSSSYEELYDGGISVPKLNRKRLDPLLISLFGCVRTSLRESDQQIWRDYLRTKKRLHPVWVKDRQCDSRPLSFHGESGDFECTISLKSNPPSDVDHIEGKQLRCPPIKLGLSTIWEVTMDEVALSQDDMIEPEDVTEQKLLLVNAGSKLKVYKNGIGIGPPCCF